MLLNKVIYLFWAVEKCLLTSWNFLEAYQAHIYTRKNRQAINMVLIVNSLTYKKWPLFCLWLLFCYWFYKRCIYREVQHVGLLDAIERNRTEQNTTILSRAKHNRAVLYYTILYCTVLYIILCYVKKKGSRAVSAFLV